MPPRNHKGGGLSWALWGSIFFNIILVAALTYTMFESKRQEKANGALILKQNVALSAAAAAAATAKATSPTPKLTTTSEDDEVSSFLEGRKASVIEQSAPDWLDGKEFLKAAKKSPVPSDKTTVTFDIHSYESMYERYLGMYKYYNEFKNKKMKLFEIGIGPDGELRSYRLYKEYLGEKLDYYCIEYENQTDLILGNTKFSPETKRYLLDHMLIGDQGKADSLNKVLEQWGPFDVIVDDGSHVNFHQIFSFEHLFLKGIRPGGVYIIEDLQTSFHPRWYGTAEKQNKHETAVTMIQDMITALHFHWWTTEKFNPSGWNASGRGSYGQVMSKNSGFKLREDIMDWVQTIDCDREICAIRKRTTKLKHRQYGAM